MDLRTHETIESRNEEFQEDVIHNELETGTGSSFTIANETHTTNKAVNNQNDHNQTDAKKGREQDQRLPVKFNNYDIDSATYDENEAFLAVLIHETGL